RKYHSFPLPPHFSTFFLLIIRPTPTSTLFPYTTLFRSLARRFAFARKLLCAKCCSDHEKCNRRSRLHLRLAAATAFWAASARSSAAISSTPLSFNNFFPRSTFVPSNRITSGTDRFIVFAALMMPCAI